MGLVSKGKLRLGDLVTVCWDGYNYNCKVVEIEEKRVKVHYLKWSSGYDEWVALSGTSHEGDSTMNGEDSAGVPPQNKKRKIQAATSKGGESAARGHLRQHRGHGVQGEEEGLAQLGLQAGAG